MRGREKESGSWRGGKVLRRLCERERGTGGKGMTKEKVRRGDAQKRSEELRRR